MMTNEELLALLKKNPIGVICGVLSLALGAGIYFRSDEVPAAEAELAQKSEEGARLAANLQNAAQLKEQNDALTIAEKELESRLMHASQTLTNLQLFYKLESDTGVKMTVNSQGSLAAAPKSAGKTIYSIVPFTITVQGSIAQLVDYLHRLESNARYCRVVSVTCSAPTSERGAPITLALNLELLGVP